MNSPAYLRVFSEFGVEVRLGERLITADPEGTSVRAGLRNEYSDKETPVAADAVVVDHGTLPNDEVYLELRERSRNRGAIDLEAWVHGRPQPEISLAEADAPFVLYRIGDAVASRNVHAAVLEGLRVGMAL